MTDVLTPSECAALSEIEAKMTPGKWEAVERKPPFRRAVIVCRDYYGREFQIPRIADDRIGIVELRNAAPRMLATIAAHEATIEALKKYIRERD